VLVRVLHQLVPPSFCQLASNGLLAQRRRLVIGAQHLELVFQLQVLARDFPVLGLQVLKHLQQIDSTQRT